MDCTKLTIGLMVVAATIGLFGGFTANYIWWLINKIPKKYEWIINLIGICVSIVFLWLIIQWFDMFTVL